MYYTTMCANKGCIFSDCWRLHCKPSKYQTYAPFTPEYNRVGNPVCDFYLSQPEDTERWVPEPEPFKETLVLKRPEPLKITVAPLDPVIEEPAPIKKRKRRIMKLEYEKI